MDDLNSPEYSSNIAVNMKCWALKLLYFSGETYSHLMDFKQRCLLAVVLRFLHGFRDAKSVFSLTMDVDD